MTPRRVISCLAYVVGPRKDAKHEITPSMVYFRGWHAVGHQKDANHKKTPAGGVVSCLAYVVEPRKMPSMKSHPRWCGFVLGMWLGIGWAQEKCRSQNDTIVSVVSCSACVGGPSWEAFVDSVAEVQFRTDAENRNWPNRTDSSVQVRFSPATPVVSSVLGSQISKILRTSSEPVRTGPNRFYFQRKSPGNNQEITLIFNINGDVVGVSTLTSTDSHDKSLRNARTNDNNDWGMGC